MAGSVSTSTVVCFVCEQNFDLQNEAANSELTQFEAHLIRAHKVILPRMIDREQLGQYCATLNSFEELKSSERCSTLVMERFDKQVVYYMIDKAKMNVEDDEFMKNIIEKDFLEMILQSAQQERSGSDFNRSCLFCKKTFVQNRAQLFDHLHHDHNFFLGHPDNIINSHQLLDILEKKLQTLQCLYCEKNFKSWNVLKEHMRKKGHKLLNPNNREYDQFYLINYLCTDKHWKQIKKEIDFFVDNDDWCDWVEDDRLDCVCFFCDHHGKFDCIKQHMIEHHRFDFASILSLKDFYDRIKVVNYIRKQMLTKQCIICEHQFNDSEHLMKHLCVSNHITQLPTKQQFNHPEFYFPTYEEDSFLFFLDDFPDIDP